MGDLARDLRYSVRMLFKNPVFTAAAVVTLALGIGLNAASFSAIHGILLKPLAGTEAPEELLQLYRQWPGMDYGSNSIPHYQDLRDRTGDVFESVGAWYFQQFAVASGERSERVIGMMVSANFFQTYGATPTLGRAFLPGTEDRDPGAHPVAVLGHGFWQGRFGGDPEIVGQTIRLNGNPFEVVGIAAMCTSSVNAIAFATPIAVPPPWASTQSAPTARAACRAARATSIGTCTVISVNTPAARSPSAPATRSAPARCRSCANTNTRCAPSSSSTSEASASPPTNWSARRPGSPNWGGTAR